MENFTPGPWKVDAAAETVTAENGRIVVYELGTNEADGHLISAAPELYAIAKIVIQEMGIEDTEHYDALVAAIAKAEGKKENE
jgi:hypothetical protein